MQNTPMELKEAIHAAQSKGLSEMAVLQHWLRVPISSSLSHKVHLLRDAVILGVDAEWWEWDPERVTELGISLLDPHHIKDWRSPWLILRQMVTQHARIKENAHLVNAKSCKGYPDKFAFGKTTFIDAHVAPFMLKDFFCHRDGQGNLRPVILLGHAIENDVRMIKDRFGLDIDELNVVVATIDTQVLAVEASIAFPGRKLGLSRLLQTFDLTEEYLHNAGNDIVCTMIVAVLMAMPHSRNSYVEFYNHLKMYLSADHKPKWGIATFCTRCDSHEHVKENCDEYVICIHCYTCSACTENRFSHRLAKCIKRDRRCSQAYRSSMRYAVPCPSCIMSSNPERHDEDYAYGHTQEDCPHKQEDCCCIKDQCDCKVPMSVDDVVDEMVRKAHAAARRVKMD